jgi:5-methylcytosine-specific restriction endonuclease McrA
MAQRLRTRDKTEGLSSAEIGKLLEVCSEMLVQVSAAAEKNAAIFNEFQQWKQDAEQHNHGIKTRIEELVLSTSSIRELFWPTGKESKIEELYKKSIPIPELGGYSAGQLTVIEAVGDERWRQYHWIWLGNVGSRTNRETVTRIEKAIEGIRRDLNAAERRERNELGAADRRERKKAREQRVQGLAAAFQGKSRKQAEKIKRAIRDQVRKLPDCPYCASPLGSDPHADHIYPISRGGLSTEDNMVYICSDCNSDKSDMTLRDFAKLKNLDWPRLEAVLDLLGKRF